MTVRTFDDAVIDDSMTGESFDNDILSLIAENKVLRADTEQVLDNLTNILTSINSVLNSLNIKFGSYITSNSEVEELYSNLEAPEDLYTKASDSLTLSEYFTQVMGFSEEKYSIMSGTAMFVQLLNDLRNQILTCSTGLVAVDGVVDGVSQYGEREEAVTAFNQHINLRVAGNVNTYSEKIIDNLKSRLTQHSSGIYDGLSRAGIQIEGQADTGQWEAGGSPSIGGEQGESSVADIQEPLSDIGDDPTGIAAYLLYATRDFTKHLALQAAGIRSGLKNYVEGSVTNSTKIEEIDAGIFGDTGSQAGKTILEYGLEDTGAETAIYSEIVMQSWSSELKSSNSNPVNYLPFDIYSLVNADSAYLPAIQIFINHMLTESGTAGSTLLNPRRFSAFSSRISSRISTISTYTKDLILARGSSGYNSARLFEECIWNLQGVLNERYSGTGDSINRVDLTRMYIFLLAEKDEEVDNALLNFLLIRSTVKRAGADLYLSDEGLENDPRTASDTRSEVASITGESIDFEALASAYYTAGAILANAVRDYASFGASSSSGGTISVGSEIFDSLSLAKRTFSSSDPFREGGTLIDEYDASSMGSTTDSISLRNDLTYDSLIRAILYNHGEGNELFDILWTSVSNFQDTAMSKYQTLSGFTSDIEDSDILTYQADGINRYGRETASYIFIKKFLSETIFMTFNRGVTSSDYSASSEDHETGDYGDNDPAYYTFREGVFRLTSSGILDSYSDPYSYEIIQSVIANHLDDRFDGFDGRDITETTIAAGDRAIWLGSIYSSLVNEDAKCINILHYLNEISQEMTTAALGLVYYTGTETETDEGPTAIPGEPVSSDVLAFLRQNRQGQNMLLTLTRDSLMTSKYLHKGYQDHRQYDFQIAIKNFDAEQISNMIQALSQDLSSYLPYVDIKYDLTPTAYEGRKKVLIAGIPAGVSEYLRYKGAWLQNDSRYLNSTYLKITVHRRNLQDDSEVSIPKDFYFDMSSYILEGLEGIDDSASLRSDTQSITSLFANTILGLTRFEPDTIQEQDTVESDLLTISGETISLTASGEKVFQNHFFDYYIKMYLKVILGIDVFEDSFSFNSSETISLSCDADKEEIFNGLESDLSTLYSASELDFNSAEIEFNKMRTIIAQTSPFSSIKYRNRALFSRIFDRVFCIYVDIDDFEIEETDTDSIGLPSSASPNFYQIYTTFEIVPEIP